DVCELSLRGTWMGPRSTSSGSRSDSSTTAFRRSLRNLRKTPRETITEACEATSTAPIGESTPAALAPALAPSALGVEAETVEPNGKRLRANTNIANRTANICHFPVDHAAAFAAPELKSSNLKLQIRKNKSETRDPKIS